MSAKNLTYWIATVLVCGFMAFASYAYLSRDATMMASFASLGYPDYFPTLLAGAKILGVLALLAPGTPLLKEWAYAGFTFTFLGACCSHLASHQENAALMPVIALAVLGLSYATRPADRRLSFESELEHQEHDVSGLTTH